MRRNCLRIGRSPSFYLSIRRAIKETVVTRAISLLPTSYKSISNVLLSRLNLYAEEIIGDRQCRFRRNTSIADYIFYVRKILEKKQEFNEAVHQLFVDFKKAYDSVRREVLYNISIEFVIPYETGKANKNVSE